MKRSLLFLHAAKTGGSATTGVVSNRFPPSECAQFYFWPAPDLKDLDRFRYVSGHFSITALDRFRTPPFVFTLLRDPIDRALSSYSFARAFPPAYEPNAILPGRGPEAPRQAGEYGRLARELSIEDLLERAPEIARDFLGNRQARMLAGSDPKPGDERLEEAIVGLDRCDFVGLTARLDESVDWLARRIGWRSLSPIPRSNVSANPLRAEDLSPGTMDILRELSSVDAELFEHARARYHRQVSEWTALSDPRDSSSELPDAPLSADLRFDGPIPGGGWMARERVADQPPFCWMGRDRAWVDLEPATDADSLIVEIPHAMDPRILEGLQIWIDERAVDHDLTEANGVAIATAPLTGARPRDDGVATTVSIEADRALRPCDLDPKSIDDRRLSIAVRRIALLRL